MRLEGLVCEEIHRVVIYRKDPHTLCGVTLKIVMSSIIRSQVFQSLVSVGGIISDTHVVLASGRHGNAYVNKDAIYPYSKEMLRIGNALLLPFIDDGIEVVLGPTIGGVALSQWTSFWLAQTTTNQTLALYAEKQADGSFALTRGYDKLIAGKRTLVVEDILTTGGSVKKVVDAARKCGAVIVGVSAICNRGNVTAEMVGDVPRLESLIELDFETWSEEECPLCKSGAPINTSVGKGREFLKRKEEEAA